MGSTLHATGFESGHHSAQRYVNGDGTIASLKLDYGKATTESQLSWEAFSAPNEFGKAQALMMRAEELNTRYNQTWALEDVEERIQVIRDALACMLGEGATDLGISVPHTAKRMLDSDPGAVINGWLELASALSDRYRHIGQLEDLNGQIQIIERALALLSDNPGKTALIKRELGAALRTRFHRSGSPPDIQEAIRLHSSLLDQHGASQPDHHWFLYELGHTLYSRFETFGDDEDLTRCIALQTEATALFPESDPWRFLAEINLGDALKLRHFRTRDVACLHASSSLFRGILRTQSPNHRDRYLACRGFSACMGMLYELTGNLTHLDECIAYGRQALRLQDMRIPTRWRLLANLAIALNRRYLHSGTIADIQESIMLLRQGLNLLGQEDGRGAVVSVLGSMLTERYEALGEPDDLDEGIRLLRDGPNLRRRGHPRQRMEMNNLGRALFLRYRRDGNAEDIAEATDLYRNSLALLSGSGAQGPQVFNLIGALSEDGQHEGSLEEARALCESSMAASQGNEQPELRLMFLHRFAKTLSIFYERYHRTKDLTMAVLRYEEALAYYPEGHANRHNTLIELATLLRRQFEVVGAEEDVERAAKLLTGALASLREGHPDRATALFEFAQLNLVQGTPFYSISSALQTLSRAVSDRHQNAQRRLTSGLDILRNLENEVFLFQEDPQLRHALLDVYVETTKLLPRVAHFGLDMKSRLRVLASSDELATNGAAHALLLTQPNVAIELLEQGRAVFWSQHLRLRTAFNALPSDLADKLTQAAFMLERGSHSAVRAVDENQTKASQEIETAKRRRLGDDFEALIEQARALPGFERFALPEPFQALCAATAQGPVVVLLACELTCQAIIIENAEKVHQVQLTDVSSQSLKTLSQAVIVAIHRGRDLLRGRAMRKSHTKTGRKAEDVLYELWRKVVRKIVDAMELKQGHGRSRPRVTLCPTGVFVHLPLHAAGVYQEGNNGTTDCFSDYCVPSYTPTIGALLNARRRGPTAPITEARVLLAAVSKPFKWTPLHFVAEEIRSIKSSISSHIPLDFLGDVECPEIQAVGPPTVEGVLKKLPSATILHLACHGYQDSHDALKSGFVMQDSMLTVAQLMALNLDKAFLAFLSACETAKGDKAQPDQAIHLAATMLFAGFRSVVGTMWSMDDIDGPTVAQAVYEELYRTGAEVLDPDTIPYALDLAVRKLQAKGLSASRWASYVHIGV